MLSTRFSFNLLIFSEDGKKGYGGNERRESKSWRLPKKVTDLALQNQSNDCQRFVVANWLACEYNPRPSVVVDDVIFL